ncbi:universal stress protein [Natranaeroarchaeum aerophilus]|uniref:Universal stress protein n=1 Tax=Natranaeroarchaeum aerophilus TaxID=2917711 RepID=A0AAE3FQV9_9EURY|nr:universal stress protein [Natranaeroarchaeum aerophilus]MCL9813932.1 universal stress protein [Natranaeroarchaeum aerophilus]
MPRTVLVPIDGSEQSYGGVAYALESFPAAELTSLYVIDAEKEWEIFSGPGLTEDWESQVTELAEKRHDRAETLASEYDTHIERDTRSGSPRKQIIKYVIDHDIDHIVMGRHGESSVSTPFMGQVTEAVIRRSPVSVSVVPLTAREVQSAEWPGAVLVPFDGSDPATDALEYTLTQFESDPVTALHVIEGIGEYDAEGIEGTYLEEQLQKLSEDADELLDTAERLASGHGTEIHTATEYGRAGRSIIEYGTANGFDQIIMGSHGRTGISRIVLGSVAETVARRSPIPVSLVRDVPDSS